MIPGRIRRDTGFDEGEMIHRFGKFHRSKLVEEQTINRR